MLKNIVKAQIINCSNDQDEFKLLRKQRNDYEQAINIDSKNSNAHYCLAYLLSETFHEYEQAKTHFEKYIELDPNNQQTHFNLAILLEDHFHEYGAAKKHYEKIIELNPNCLKAYFNIAQLLEEHCFQYGEAKKYYEKVIELDPKNIEAYKNLAILLDTKLNEYEEAKIHYEKVIELNPDNADIHTALATLLKTIFHDQEKAKEHFEKALNIYNQALIVDSQLIDIQGQKGIVLLCLNRDIEALQSFEEVLKNFKEGQQEISHQQMSLINEIIKIYYRLKEKTESPLSFQINQEVETKLQADILIKNTESEIKANPALEAYYNGFVFGLTQIYNTSCLIASGKFAINTNSILQTSVETLLSLIPIVGDKISQGTAFLSEFVQKKLAKQKAIEITQIANTITDFDRIAKSACLKIIEAKTIQIQNVTETDLKHNSIGQMLMKAMMSSVSNVSVESSGERYNSPASKLAYYDVGKIGLQMSKKNGIGKNPSDDFANIVINDRIIMPLEVSTQKQNANDEQHCCSCIIFSLTQIQYDSPILQAIQHNPNVLKCINNLSQVLKLSLIQQRIFLCAILNREIINLINFDDIEYKQQKL